jgi:hypothetical protein
MSLDLSEILLFLLLICDYEFELKILYIDEIGSKENI